MTVRKSITAILLAAMSLVVVAAAPVRAAGADADTSAYAPRLIDPTSPPPGEGNPATASGVNTPATAAPAPAPARQPEAKDTRASDEDADINKPAVDDIELQINADVLKYIAFFTGGGRSTFERWLKRSGRYMDLFRGVLQKEGLPPDLVHLVFVESGFNVNARSYAAAVGPWQFMRSSAQLFGLNVNQWVDERRDPEKATVAAARYLKHLYGIFGDWPLALASYNAGEGTVMRAIQHQGTTNYWELRLPKQTEEYVPQFMAALAISRDPVKYGFGDIEMDDPMRFDELAMKGTVDLHAVAKLAECSYDELRELNPQARTSMLRGANGITTVRVPEGKSELIQKNLAAGVELPTVNLTVRHRVRRGETLRMIATEYAVNPTELARANNLGRGRPLRRGMLLTVPASFRAPRPEMITTEDVDPRASTDYVPERRIGLPGKIEGNSVAIERVTHTVKRGETLRSIAVHYGVTVTELKKWNRITTPGVRIGTRLRIRDQEDAPSPADAVASRNDGDAKARAARADAAKPEVAKQDDRKADDARPSAAKADVARPDMARSDADKSGAARSDAEVAPKPRTSPVADAAVLDTPAGGKDDDAAKPDRVPAQRTHTVRVGETLLDIARRHHVSADELRKLNGLRSPHVTPGQRLLLPA